MQTFYTYQFTEKVEVWNDKHQGDVSVEVVVSTNTPPEHWTSRDWEALGDFVASNYVEGDESRDVRYIFSR